MNRLNKGTYSLLSYTKMNLIAMEISNITCGRTTNRTLALKNDIFPKWE
jgi:hypothetical protein